MDQFHIKSNAVYVLGLIDVKQTIHSWITFVNSYKAMVVVVVGVFFMSRCQL